MDAGEDLPNYVELKPWFVIRPFLDVLHIKAMLQCLWRLITPRPTTLAPFYGASFLGFRVGIHQHAACEPNNPDFRVSCGDAIPDPLTSFLYWRMEYHIEHRMFVAIPCYNLKAFSRFVADQLPPKERAFPQLLRLNRVCREKYGSYRSWRDTLGVYKGL